MALPVALCCRRPLVRLASHRGDTYEKVNGAAEMRWHLERARIIASIENEMTAERRHSTKLSYVNLVNDKLYLQVCVCVWRVRVACVRVCV